MDFTTFNAEAYKRWALVDHDNKRTAMCFDVEMETGMSQTYSYIKSIFEMNKRYGWQSSLDRDQRRGLSASFGSSSFRDDFCSGSRTS